MGQLHLHKRAQNTNKNRIRKESKKKTKKQTHIHRQVHTVFLQQQQLFYLGGEIQTGDRRSYFCEDLWLYTFYQARFCVQQTPVLLCWSSLPSVALLNNRNTLELLWKRPLKPRELHSSPGPVCPPGFESHCFHLDQTVKGAPIPADGIIKK